MKKVLFSVILLGAIIISGFAGFTNQDRLADKQGDFGSAILLPILDK